MDMRRQVKDIGRTEFVLMMALVMSMLALSTDAMLPALVEIGKSLGVRNANLNQLVVTMIFLGLASSQIVFGPLSDATGRKPAMYAALVIFIIGSLLSLFATSFATMLVGRFLQGVGAAGPRVVSLAIVRDRYDGDDMARILSLVMGIFIVVPVFAPTIGQSIMLLTSWHAIFGLLLAMAITGLVWFWLRLPETLVRSERRPWSFRQCGSAIAETCRNRIALGYTIVTGFVFGAFISYLSSAQQILGQQYGLGDLFPLYFALNAISMGVGALLNAQLVVRFGMRFLTRWSLIVMSTVSSVFVVMSVLNDGHPALWVLMSFFVGSISCVGVIFSNGNALAIESLGHIAGTASSVIGSLSLLISITASVVIGQMYDGTVMPIALGFFSMGIAAFLTMIWTEWRRPKEAV